MLNWVRSKFVVVKTSFVTEFLPTSRYNLFHPAGDLPGVGGVGVDGDTAGPHAGPLAVHHQQAQPGPPAAHTAVSG